MSTKPRKSRTTGKSVGAPRHYDRVALAISLEKYINDTEIPILAEFAYQNNVLRETLYDMPELSTLIKRCMTKKESQLERKTLAGETNTPMAIFSLKQLGWSDKNETMHKGDPKAPIALVLNGSDVHG